MRITKINTFSERVYTAVLKLLPQLDADAVLPTRQYFKSILRSENIHFFIAEQDNKQIAGMLTIGTCRLTSGIKSLDRRCDS